MGVWTKAGRTHALLTSVRPATVEPRTVALHAAIVSLAFILLGLTLTVAPETFDHPGRSSAPLIRLVGIACVAFSRPPALVAAELRCHRRSRWSHR